MSMKANILLVEDDMNLGFVVADQLRSNEYNVTLATDGAEGFKRFNDGNYHLCIFDVMMPKKDGFSLAQDIRKIDKDIPILFLTAKSDTQDKVKGFESGGDDYLTKPFSTEELMVRVKALLKRVNIVQEEENASTYKIGQYTFDSENYELKSTDFQKKLTKKEAEILSMLCKYKNQVLPRELVLNGVWGQDDYFVGRSLDVFITKLRKYLSGDDRVAITNVHGIGFKFICPEE
ncbi:response regulator transcription factor [Wandonia haliotis]|uniref:Response regulator transcription factor n=2 Tax=Wandonia haliotis TaxID=574963 RepID=A0ABN1MQJ2_9FLAO